MAVRAAQETDVLRGFGLCAAGGQRGLERRGVHAVGNDQPLGQIGAEHGQPIGHRRAPVVAHHGHRPASFGLDQRGHVAHQFGQGIVFHRIRSPALAVSALIRGNAMETVGQKRREFGPGPAVFGKAVQQEQHRQAGIAPAADKEWVAVQVHGLGSHGFSPPKPRLQRDVHWPDLSRKRQGC